MKKKMFQKVGAYLLSASMILSMNGLSSITVSAAKTPKLSKSTVSLNVGASKTLTIKNKPAKLKTKWSSKNKKVAKVTQKGKITGVKKGKTTITCKLTYKKGKKSIKKSLSASVTVKEKTTTATEAPVTTTTTVATPIPTTSGAITTTSIPSGTPANAPETTAASTLAPTDSSSAGSTETAAPADVASSEPATEVSAAPADVASSEPATEVSAAPADVSSSEPATEVSAAPADVSSSEPATEVSAAPADVSSSEPATEESAAPADVSSSEPATEESAAPVDAASSEPAVEETTAPEKATPVPLTEKELKALLDESNLGEEHKSASGQTTKDNGLMRKELTSLDLIDNVMNVGWNLGNQMEQSNYKGMMTTVEQCETSAGNPKATQTTFDGLKNYGINTVRIPVAWSNFMSTDGNYTISPELLDRVEEIVNYALNDEMYVIINEHWDGGWWGMFGSPDENVQKEAWKKYEAIWTQVSERFKDYSDHLVFEGGNEELSSAFPTTENWGLNTKVGADGFLDATQPAGIFSEDEIYETAAKISQKFVDIVRASGGNNAYRHLLIPGNTTAIDKATDERFVMPTDSEENGNNKLSVSVHIYDPNGYALTASSSDEGYRSSWGSDEDKEELRNLVSKVSKFTDQGYGVIAGECGVVKADKDNIIDWMQFYFELCKEFHITPVWWDEGHYFNREYGYFNYKDVGHFFTDWTGATYTLPEGTDEKNLQETGVCQVPTVENKNPKVVYTWTGEFMRHTNKDSGEKLVLERGDEIDYNETSGEAGIGRTDSISDGMTATFDPEYWNITLGCDWSTFEQPCIRVYPMENVTSMGADLQLGYRNLSYKNSGVKNAADYTGNWLGEYIELDKGMIYEHEETNRKGEVEIKAYPDLWITTNTYTGASYVKIEFCDAAYNADGTPFESANTDAE